MADPQPDPPPAVIPVVHYSSAAQRPQDRHAAWREGSLLAFGRHYDTTPLTPFAVETTLAQLGPIGVAHARMSAQDWHRTTRHVRSDEAEPLMVAIRFAGHASGDADGRPIDVPAGAIALSDFGRPIVHTSSAADNVVLRIPRELAERALPAVRTLHGLVIPPSAAALLRAHTWSLGPALKVGLAADQVDRLARVAIDLLTVAIAQTQPHGPVDPAAVATAVRLAAEAAIERGLGSTRLTVDSLCRSVGVSRSALYRLFEPDGGIQAYIRQRRLARIEQELRAGGREPLWALAERWGFSDGGHLSRLFRQRYQLSPSDFRALHRGEG